MQPNHRSSSGSRALGDQGTTPNLFTALWDHIRQAQRRQYEAIEPNMTICAVIGAVGFPLYFVMWEYLFPQPYENLFLRLSAGAVCLLMAFRNAWPRPLKRFVLPFFFLATTYCLPFFFTFMALQSGLDIIWLLSAMAALFLLIMLMDGVSLIASFALGVTAAWLASRLTGGLNYPASNYLEIAPIFAFVFLCGILYNFRAEYIRQERLLAAAEATAAVSARIQAPLQAAKASALGLSQSLPSLVTLARQANLAPNSGLDDDHLLALAAAPDQIVQELDRTMTMADMAVIKARNLSPTNPLTRLCSIRACLDEAQRRFAFSSEREKARLSIPAGQDFVFQGTHAEMVQILVNLLDNAFRAIRAKGYGQVEVTFSQRESCNVIAIRDEGQGVPEAVAGRVFDRFYSYAGDAGDLGLGLTFCKQVIEDWGGKVSFDSQEGIGSQVQILLPMTKADIDLDHSRSNAATSPAKPAAQQPAGAAPDARSTAAPDAPSHAKGD